MTAGQHAGHSNPAGRALKAWLPATAAGSVGLAALGFVAGRQPAWLLALAPATLMLVVGHWRRRGWAISAWFVVQVLLAAGSGVPAAWMLPAALLALAHWDLDHFERRLDRAARVIDRPTLVRRHAILLAGALLIGGVLAAGSLMIEIQLAFAGAAVLVIVLLLGLGRLVRVDLS